jgi:predicted ferric reductase
MKVWAFVLGACAAGVVVGNGQAAALLSRGLQATGPHGAWYASRAAGIASYLFLWLGLVGGLLMSSAWFDGMLSRARLLAFHQAASIAGVLLGVAHGLVLIEDDWTHFGLFDVLVPFGSYYKTLLTGVGTLALYLAAVVSVSFWFRRQIGMKAWRYLHYTSLAAFAGAFWHGVSIGTDSRSAWLMVTYLATTLAVVFGVLLRITYRRAAVKRSTVPVRSEAQAA